MKQSQPWTVMCSYNKVNGAYASENETLLTRILREEWGFEGFVVSDWEAVNDRVKGLAAGLELEMPANGGFNDAKLVEAVRNGSLSEQVLDQAVERMLRVIFMAVEQRKEGAVFDPAAHHALARTAAQESMVLLKNQGELLPLPKAGTVAVIGEFAEKPRYQGGGSSHVNPTRLDAALPEIRAVAEGADILYAAGFRIDNDIIDEELIQEARTATAQADAAVLFLGLPDSYESEGYDRTHMSLPSNQLALLEAYVSDTESSVIRPRKELKAFRKVELQPGETQTVTFELDKRAFAFYHTGVGDSVAETGEYELLAGRSSRDIVVQTGIHVESTSVVQRVYHRNTLLGDLHGDPQTMETAKRLMKATGLLGAGEEDELMMAIMKYLPLRGAVAFSQGKLTDQELEDILRELNGESVQAGNISAS